MGYMGRPAWQPLLLLLSLLGVQCYRLCSNHVSCASTRIKAVAYATTTSLKADNAEAAEDSITKYFRESAAPSGGVSSIAAVATANEAGRQNLQTMKRPFGKDEAWR
jgi:hypothetical protein